MIIGVPKEIKNHEYRIGLTPSGARELISHGHKVMVQHDGGKSIGLTNEMYQKAGMADYLEYNFVMGVASGMPCDADLLALLPRWMASGSVWQSTLIGRAEIWPVHQATAELGGMLRTGLEDTFYLPDGREFTLPTNNAVLFYIQRLRDEAHRFAIGAHRAKRSKAMGASPLDEVPGIGPSRKKALLMHFGTARAIRGASLEDLQKAPGVSAAVAQSVYDFYNPGS